MILVMKWGRGGLGGKGWGRIDGKLGGGGVICFMCCSVLGGIGKYVWGEGICGGVKGVSGLSGWGNWMICVCWWGVGGGMFEGMNIVCCRLGE